MWSNIFVLLDTHVQELFLGNPHKIKIVTSLPNHKCICVHVYHILPIQIFQLPAGAQTYIHFPVLPILPEGEVTVRITAFSPIDRDEEEINVRVTVMIYLQVDQPGWC